MSQYYNSQRTSNLYQPGSKFPYRLSRSKIDLYLNCPRCFYLDRRLGISQPPGYPFTLNNAVDILLKKEFDIYRAEGTADPLMKVYGLKAVPFHHKKIEEWRDAKKRGITFLHRQTNLLIAGGIDDVWINDKKELIIIDYKATSKNEEINLDAPWQIGYKRQMEIYQWLFRNNGFKVSDTGYFVYVNGKTDRKAFDGKLEFDVKLIPYKGDASWVEKTILDVNECLNSKKIPPYTPECDFCSYNKAIKNIS